jgi:hypothetical protein
MALSSQPTTGRGSSDVWDETLFGQAVEKAKIKTDTLQKVAGDALLATQQSKLLPMVISSKLLLPLTGVFMALFVTTTSTTWQSGLGNDLLAKLESNNSYQQLVPGYNYLGAVGLTLETELEQKVKLLSVLSELPQKNILPAVGQLNTALVGQFFAWPERADKLATVAATTGNDVISTFSQSLNSFKQGVIDIYVTVKTSLVSIFSSLNQSFSDLYDNLLSGVGFLSDRIELAVDSFFRPVKTSANHGWQESVATVAQVNEGLNKLTIDVGQVWQWSKVKVVSWWQGVVKSWQDFLAGFGSSSAPALQVDQEVKSDVKEIKQDVKSLIKAFNEQGVPVKNQQGMVVVPSTGSAESDATIKARIANMFSDPVQVQLDETKQSGVITPNFTTGDSSNYLFLLAPIKQ